MNKFLIIILGFSVLLLGTVLYYDQYYYNELQNLYIQDLYIQELQNKQDIKNISDFSFEQERFEHVTSKVLLPVVKIAIKEPDKANGTGILIADLIKNEIHTTYILTAAHVALNAIDDQEINEITLKGKKHPIYITVYQYDTNGTVHSFLTLKASIVIIDQDKDLALLKILPHKYNFSIAKLKDKNKSLQMGDQTIAVGCGLGLDPLISYGNFNGYLYDGDGNLKGTQNAPVTFGNSGGPLYDGFTQEVAGINVSLAGIGATFITIPQNHISFFVPHTTIWEFVEKRGFGYIFTNDLKDKDIMEEVRNNFAVPE